MRDEKKEEHEKKLIIQYGQTNPKIKENLIFPNNRICTTKYNLFTWAPKSLFMQFKRSANIYFLIITVLTCLSFSPKQPGSMIGTFAFVLICTMIKEAVEDYGRYKQDKVSNNRLVWKREKTGWVRVKCWTLMPGDIIKVEQDEEFTADTMIIKSANETGYSQVETKSLDGESNLKTKASLEDFRAVSEDQYDGIHGYVECDLPNDSLQCWSGTFTRGESKPIFCNLANMILKGCILKTPAYVCGIVIYSGKNTKIMKNSKAARFKMSKVLVTMNRLLYSVFIFDIMLCATFGALNLSWTENNESVYTYIFKTPDTTGHGVKFVINFLTFFVAYSHMIPISLYVVLEMVKVIQGRLIKYDNDMFDPSIDKPAECRATDLIEELGQVEFIFSDKTGTLTQNSMVLKKIYLHQKVYGNVKEDEPDTPFTINGDFHIERKLRSNDPADNYEKKEIIDFLYLLSLCHAVYPEKKKEEKTIYQGASPDDIALVKGAQQLGYEFITMQFRTATIRDHINNQDKAFTVLVDMPFDSNRKRMSVIVRDEETHVYKVLSKGADTVMLPRISLSQDDVEEVNRVMKVLSKEGLRVLVMGQKEIGEDEYLEWEVRFNAARVNGEEGPLFDEMEKNFQFAGCSAIEDKLQEGVSEAIYTLLTCNIRIWVLTGDKQDTAEEIAKSCKLINDNMFLLHLVADGTDTKKKIEDLKEEYGIDTTSTEEIDLEEVSRKIRKKQGLDLSIIIDGESLEHILQDDQLSLLFFHIAIAAKSVVCCRVNPKQKSKVVQLAKTYGKWVTLSIGDGANDVPMIMEAHIGVGIQGKEGTQAVRSADFSIGQFRFLEKLLLIYGRVGYVKISKFICYYFYKNIILVFTELCFAISNGFSGQIYFADYLSTLYNAFFTSWPCLFTFSLERDVDLSIVKKFPILYTAGQKNYFFNMRVFWSYIIYAIIHGFLAFFIPNLGLMNALDTSGITFNHWYKSTVSFSMIIHIVTFKLLIVSDFWNGLNLFATIFSIPFYYICLMIMCSNFVAFSFQNEIAGLLFTIVKCPTFWATIVLAPVLCLSIDITLKQMFYSACPIPTEYIKQHLKDPIFQSLVFKDETQTRMFSANEAKKAEKDLKEILRKAREYKMRKRMEIISGSSFLPVNTEERLTNERGYAYNNNLLILNDNRRNSNNKHALTEDTASNISLTKSNFTAINKSNCSSNSNTNSRKVSQAQEISPHKTGEESSQEQGNKKIGDRKAVVKINTFTKNINEHDDSNDIREKSKEELFDSEKDSVSGHSFSRDSEKVNGIGTAPLPGDMGIKINNQEMDQKSEKVPSSDSRSSAENYQQQGTLKKIFDSYELRKSDSSKSESSFK